MDKNIYELPTFGPIVKKIGVSIVSLDIKDHEAFLKGAIAIDPEEQGYLRDILYRFNQIESDQCKVICNYYLIDCAIGDIRENDFIDLISRFIIVYALRKEQYADLTKYNIMEKSKIARDKFTRLPQSGEVGELILFTLLESERNAPQILNKMSLKTDGEMHYHGLDAIHLGVWDKELQLFYGSSKLYAKLGQALNESIKDISRFSDSPRDEQLELDLINNHIDESKFMGYTKEVKKLLNPYAKKKQLRKVYAVFIGFNWNSLENINFKKKEKDLKKTLETCYRQKEAKIFKDCEKKVQKLEFDDSFEFFFIPFKDVQKIREYFTKVIS